MEENLHTKINKSNPENQNNASSNKKSNSPVYLIQSPHHYYKKIYKYTPSRNNKSILLSDPSTHELLTSHLATPPLYKHEESRHSFLMSRVSELQKAIHQLDCLRMFLEEISREDARTIAVQEISRTQIPRASRQNQPASIAPSSKDAIEMMRDLSQTIDNNANSEQYIQAFIVAKQKLVHLLRRFKKQFINNILYHRYLLQLDWRLVKDNLWLSHSDGTVNIGLTYGENGLIVRELFDEFTESIDKHSNMCPALVSPSCGKYHNNGANGNHEHEMVDEIKNGISSLDDTNVSSSNRTPQHNHSQEGQQTCWCEDGVICGSIEYVFPQGISFGFKEGRLHMKVKHVTPNQMKEITEDELQLEGFRIPPPKELLSLNYDFPEGNYQKINRYIQLAHDSLFNLQLFKCFSQVSFQNEDKIQILSYEQNEITVRVAPPNHFLRLRIEKGEDHPFWILSVDQNCILEENGGSELVKILLEDSLNRVYDQLLHNPPTTFQSELQRKNRLFSKKYFQVLSQEFLNVMFYMRHALICAKIREITPDVELLRFSYPDISDCVVYIGPNSERRVLIFVQGTQICIRHQKLQLGELKQKLRLMEDDLAE